MPRVTDVKRAQKSQGSCGGCGIELAKGEPYRWWAFRYGGKRKRCMAAKCAPRPSDLTQSKMSGVYAAQEGLQDWLNEWEGVDVSEVQEELETAVDEIRSVGEEYQESADAIRDTIQDSPTADECEEKAQELESWVDDLDSAGQDVAEYEGEVDDEGHPKDKAEATTWRDETKTTIEDALSGCPF